MIAINSTIVSTILIFLSFQITVNHSARILAVFPIPSVSHQIFFRTFTHELAKRGHEVTVITTDPAFKKDQGPPNLREIDVHDTYDIWRKHLLTFEIEKEIIFLRRVEITYKVFAATFKKQLLNKEVQDIIFKKNGDFDILLLEAWLPLALIFSHIFKVPVVQVSSLSRTYTDSKIFGASSYPLLYPSCFSRKSHNLTILEVFEQMHHDYFRDMISTSTDEIDTILPTIFGTDIPSMSQLQNNINMHFLNVYPSWINNQPLPPSIVQIGGIHKPTLQKLPKELKTFLDSSKNGVIYFSFGSNIKTSQLSKDKIRMFITVFSQLPYEIIWKWDKDFLPDKSGNIKIIKWLPQPELLKHPNVRLFITQGGLQSTDEAISAGVPLIGFPILGDQWYNADNYVYHKIGTKLDLETITENKLKNAIENIMTNESYYKNIKKLRTLMEDQPQSALERAVWWMEYVLRHGDTKHIQALGANISWAEYFELELLIIVASILISSLVLVFLSINVLLNYIKSILCNIKNKTI